MPKERFQRLALDVIGFVEHCLLFNSPYVREWIYGVITWASIGALIWFLHDLKFE